MVSQADGEGGELTFLAAAYALALIYATLFAVEGWIFRRFMDRFIEAVLRRAVESAVDDIYRESVWEAATARGGES